GDDFLARSGLAAVARSEAGATAKPGDAGNGFVGERFEPSAAEPGREHGDRTHAFGCPRAGSQPGSLAVAWIPDPAGGVRLFSHSLHAGSGARAAAGVEPEPELRRTGLAGRRPF